VLRHTLRQWQAAGLEPERRRRLALGVSHWRMLVMMSHWRMLIMMSHWRMLMMMSHWRMLLMISHWRMLLLMSHRPVPLRSTLRRSRLRSLSGPGPVRVQPLAWLRGPGPMSPRVLATVPWQLRRSCARWSRARTRCPRPRCVFVFDDDDDDDNCFFSFVFFLFYLSHFPSHGLHFFFSLSLSLSSPCRSMLTDRQWLRILFAVDPTAFREVFSESRSAGDYMKTMENNPVMAAYSYHRIKTLALAGGGAASSAARLHAAFELDCFFHPDATAENPMVDEMLVAHGIGATHLRREAKGENTYVVVMLSSVHCLLGRAP
jgi:hypothetical protein